MVRNARSHNRRAPQQQGFPHVLIVCEGKKTEPLYLNRLKFVHGLSSVHVEHMGSTNPMAIVRYALAELKKSDEWERAYCVFDGDVAVNLNAARGLLKSSRPAKAGRLFEILSVPCIEFWFLLHFEYTTKSYTRMASKSPCDALQDDLKKHWASYDKADRGIFDELYSKMPTALANAHKLAKDQASTNSPNPATRMHLLVEYLVNLKKRP